MNVLVIMTDSFRPDHVGAYGSTFCRTPCLDRFAAGATVFEKSYQASFPTVPTRADMFTGRAVYPHLGWEPLPRDWPTLAGVLRDAGYLTQMVIDTPHIMANGFFYQRGFDGWEWIRGQETDALYADPPDDQVPLPCDPSKLRSPALMRRAHYRNRLRWRLEADRFAPRTIQYACDWLECNRAREPFFLYLDTFDPHEPWDAPPWYLELYADPEFAGQVADYPCYRDARHFLGDDELRHLDALYSAEATLVDRWIGRLLGTLERLGLADRTAVLVLSDHGFYLGDHGHVGKLNGYRDDGPAWPKLDALTRTVLMVRVPGRPAARSSALVQPCDLAPTICDLLGVAAPASFTAPSYAPILRGERTAADGRAVAVTSDKAAGILSGRQYVAITDGAWTLNVAPGERAWLHHTAADPGQLHECLAEHRAEAERLLGLYFAQLEGLAPPPEVWAGQREALTLT